MSDKLDPQEIFYSLCYQDIIDVAQDYGIALTEEEIYSIGRNYEDPNWTATLFHALRGAIHSRRHKNIKEVL